MRAAARFRINPPQGRFGPFFDNRPWGTVRAERNLGLLNTADRHWTWEHFSLRQEYFVNSQSSWLRGFGNSYLNTGLRIGRSLNSSLGNNALKRNVFRLFVITWVPTSGAAGYLAGDEIFDRWIKRWIEDEE